MRLLSIIRALPRQIGYLKPSRSENSKASLTQWAEILYAYFRYELTPMEYHLYGFCEKTRHRSEMEGFLSNQWMMKYFRPALNDANWCSVLDNKVLWFISVFVGESSSRWNIVA